MKKYILQILFVFIISAAGIPVAANIVITEIMYDVPGTDDAHEWIEVKNNGNEPITMTNWKLFEGEVNHGLSIVRGNEMIMAGGYAIIASDGGTFLTDWPSFNGTVFDSVFSLTNSGESIGIKNDALQLVDSVTYSPLHGGGDGNSLHREGDVITHGTPSPGAPSLGNTLGNTEGENSSIGAGVTTDSAYKGVFIFDDAIISGVSFDIQAEVMNGATYVARGYYRVSFGDGGSSVFAVDTVKSIFTHVYEYPGNYVVAIEYFESLLSREPILKYIKNITVYAPDVTLLGYDGKAGVIIRNNSSREIDLSEWKLIADDRVFKIPRMTILRPETTVVFHKVVTRFTSFGKIILLTPRGELASQFPSLTSPYDSKAPSEKKETSLIEDFKNDTYDHAAVTSHSTVPVFSTTKIVESKRPMTVKIIWGIGSAVLGLGTFVIFIYLRKKQNSSLQKEEERKDVIRIIEGE